MKQPLYLLYLLLGIILNQSIEAQVGEPPKHDLLFDFEIDHISYIEKHSTKNNHQNLIEGNIKYKNFVNENITFSSQLELKQDINSATIKPIRLNEAYVDIHKNDLLISAGKKIIFWGQADALNITNNINPTDFSDYIDTEDEEIGVFMLHAKQYVKDFCIEGVFVPVFTEAVLPSENSRWAYEYPTSIPTGPPYNTTLSAGYDFTMVHPGKGLKSAQAASRISGYFRGWDFAFSYYYGHNNIPKTLVLNDYATYDSLHYQLTNHYYQWQIISTDFSTSFGKLGLRGEAAYFIPEDAPGIDKPYFKYIIGLDRTFSNIIKENNLMLIVQWMDDLSTEGLEFEKMDFNHVFQKSLLSRFELQVGKSAEFHLQSIYNFNSNDYYLQPKLSFRIHNTMKIKLLYDHLEGGDDSFFGYYKHNNRFQMKLNYSF